MSLTFAYPLALLGLLVLPVLYLVHRWRPLHNTAWTRRIALGLRIAAVTSLVLALARPVLFRPVDTQAVVFAVDVSPSMSAAAAAAAQDWLRRALAAMRPDDWAGIVHFSSEAHLARTLAHGVEPPPQATGDGATNVQAALRLAETAFDRPARKRIVVLSDGGENLGQGEAEARHAAGQGIEVSTVAFLPDPGTPEVLLESMDTPPRVREGEPVETTLVLYSTVDVGVTLRLWTDGRLVSQDAVHLEVGANRLVYDQGNALKKGFHSFRAVVGSPSDTIETNNELYSFTVVGNRGKVLMVEGEPGRGSGLAGLLKQGGIDVDAANPSLIPPRLDPLQQYDAMILYNVPATTFSLDQMKTIQSFVQTLGKGLVAVGGKESFGLGGYLDTPLEETLPVTMTPPPKNENPSLALVLVIDRSGSMDLYGQGVRGASTVTKMAMAREAAILAMDVLDTNDQIGVVQFDLTPRWVVPLTAVNDPANKQQIRDRIAAIKADGGTEIFPGLQMGYDALLRAQAKLKHLVLLSDGREFSSWDYEKLLGEMRQAGITLSTIAIGSDADAKLLRRLADQGQGRYQYADDPESLPKLLTHEAAAVSANRFVEVPFKPRVTAASPILRNFVGGAVPNLSGYVTTMPKPTAQVVLTSHLDDPVLAQWQYGLGRAVAYLSTLDETWASDWLEWGDGQRFWTQAVRWAMPSPLDTKVAFAADHEGKTTRLTVDVVDDDNAYVNLADTYAQVALAAPTRSEVTTIALRQTAPGRYEGTYRPAEPGAYAVQIVQRKSGQEVRNDLFGFAAPYSPEFRLNPDGALTLDRIARAGGGTAMRDPAEAFRRISAAPPMDSIDLWRFLLGLALVIFSLDVGIRSIRLPRFRV